MVKCKICQRDFSSYQGLAFHLVHSHKEITSEEYYRKYVDPNAGKCKVCGKPTKFRGVGSGFLVYCSNKCANNDPDVKEKTARTNIAKYGSLSPLCNSEVIAKGDLTKLKKYGSLTPLSNSVVQEKFKETSRRHFGCDHPLKNSLIRQKQKETNKRRFGVEYPLQNKEIQEKRSSSNLNKYGSRNTLSDPVIQSKVVAARCSPEFWKKFSKRYNYYGEKFDSSWELAFYIFYKDHGRDIEPHPIDRLFKYTYNGRQHLYFPDFKLDGKYIEIKGTHLIDSNGILVNPFDHSTDGLYAAKMRCMIEHGIEVITDCSNFVSYVNNKYGKDYLQSFRNK